MSTTSKIRRAGKAVKPTPMPNLNERFSSQQLAAAITAKRTGLKLSLVEVSEALSISKPTLVKIEKGDPNVKLKTLLTVMEYLGLSFHILSDTPLREENELSDYWY